MGLSSFQFYRRRMVEEETAKKVRAEQEFKAELKEAGVGATVAERLMAAGYTSREDLALADPEELREIEGLGEARLVQLQEWAKGEAQPEDKDAENGEENAEPAELAAPGQREEPNWEAMTVSELEHFGQEYFPELELKGLKPEKMKALRREWRKANKEQ